MRADLLVLIENRLHLNVCVCCFQGWLPPYRTEVVGAWDGELVNIARVFGMLLNFNCALVLVPMFRAILTYLQVERHHERDAPPKDPVLHAASWRDTLSTCAHDGV